MDNCIFCLIGSKKIASQVVYEDDLVLAFNDLNPQAPVHVLLIPKKHIENVSSATYENESLLGHLVRTAATVAQLTGVDRGGYRIVVNNGADAGQSVSHLHLHVLGGRTLTWPPG